jgi:hypothetical protein
LRQWRVSATDPATQWLGQVREQPGDNAVLVERHLVDIDECERIADGLIPLKLVVWIYARSCNRDAAVIVATDNRDDERDYAAL